MSKVGRDYIRMFILFFSPSRLNVICIKSGQRAKAWTQRWKCAISSKFRLLRQSNRPAFKICISSCAIYRTGSPYGQEVNFIVFVDHLSLIIMCVWMHLVFGHVLHISFGILSVRFPLEGPLSIRVVNVNYWCSFSIHCLCCRCFHLGGKCLHTFFFQWNSRVFSYVLLRHMNLLLLPYTVDMLRL